jgi:hypothetical protein
MNIAEKLRNLPKGNVLYSPAFGEVIFKEIVRNNIVVEDICKIERTFLYDGRFYADGECMLFPSKENREWETFTYCPFKNGDVIIRNDGKFIAIFSHVGIEEIPYTKTVNYHCWVKNDGTIKYQKDYGIGNYLEFRLATEKEKEFFFGVLAEKGFKWNSNTLTLEKEIQKFSVKMLKPFDKVLTRDFDGEIWTCDIFSHIVKDYDNQNIFRCAGTTCKQCIIYNDVTKYLVGTDKDCPEYFKTW